MRVRLSHVAASLLVSAGMAFAASERGTATTTLGGQDVTIDYGRPALKGRSLAELMKALPEDRIWRAGDDQVTTLTTATALQIGDKTLPEGKYSVYVHLAENGNRDLVINSDLGIPLIKIWDKAPASLANEKWPRLDGYQKNVSDKEVLRVAMSRQEVPAPVDVFTIAFKPDAGGAILNFSWGDESWSVPVKAAQ